MSITCAISCDLCWSAVSWKIAGRTQNCPTLVLERRICKRYVLSFKFFKFFSFPFSICRVIHVIHFKIPRKPIASFCTFWIGSDLISNHFFIIQIVRGELHLRLSVSFESSPCTYLLHILHALNHI